MPPLPPAAAAGLSTERLLPLAAVAGLSTERLLPPATEVDPAGQHRLLPREQPPARVGARCSLLLLVAALQSPAFFPTQIFLLFGPRLLCQNQLVVRTVNRHLSSSGSTPGATERLDATLIRTRN